MRGVGDSKGLERNGSQSKVQPQVNVTIKTVANDISNPYIEHGMTYEMAKGAAAPQKNLSSNPYQNQSQSDFEDEESLEMSRGNRPLTTSKQLTNQSNPSRGGASGDGDEQSDIEEIGPEVAKKKKKKIIKKIIKKKNADGTDAPPQVIIIEKTR